MNDTHFKSAQNLLFLKDTVEILSSPPSILLALHYCSTMWNATSKSGKIGAPLTKMVITQCTMGQFGSNFQELLLRHVPQ